LLLEFWVFGFHVTPGHFSVRQVAHNSGNFIQLLFLNKKSYRLVGLIISKPQSPYRNSNLGHGIAFAQRCTVRLLERVEIDCYTEWDSNLIRTGVAATDGSARIIHAIGNVKRAQITS